MVSVPARFYLKQDNCFRVVVLRFDGACNACDRVRIFLC